MLRISLHQAHILLNNSIADLTIPFTNRVSEFKIVLLKLSTMELVQQVRVLIGGGGGKVPRWYDNVRLKANVLEHDYTLFILPNLGASEYL